MPARSRTGQPGFRTVLSETRAVGCFSMTRLYVGNLPYSAGEEELRELFEQHGTVVSVSVVMDRETGRSRGFGFVEMEAGDAEGAINALNGKDMDGRALVVNEARPREERGGGGGYRGGGGGGGYRGGGGGGHRGGGGGGWGGGGGGGRGGDRGGRGGGRDRDRGDRGDRGGW